MVPVSGLDLVSKSKMLMLPRIKSLSFSCGPFDVRKYSSIDLVVYLYLI